MPHATFPVTQDGFLLPVVIGLTGLATRNLMSAGQPVPRPILLQGEIDTGSNITCVAARVLSQLGLSAASGSHTTQTVAGSHAARLFEVSLGIPAVGALKSSLLVLEHLWVMEWTPPSPVTEVLIGRDVLPHLLMVIDGPRQEFTLGD
jgi:hypothetical protein